MFFMVATQRMQIDPKRWPVSNRLLDTALDLAGD